MNNFRIYTNLSIRTRYLKLNLLEWKSTCCKQECIPVGCVPAARRPYAGVCLPGGCLLPGGLLWGGVLPGRGVSAPGGCVCSRGVYPSMHWGRPPPVDRHTFVKILPWPNFVATGNKYWYFTLSIGQVSRTSIETFTDVDRIKSNLTPSRELKIRNQFLLLSPIKTMQKNKKVYCNFVEKLGRFSTFEAKSLLSLSGVGESVSDRLGLYLELCLPIDMQGRGVSKCTSLNRVSKCTSLNRPRGYPWGRKVGQVSLNRARGWGQVTCDWPMATLPSNKLCMWTIKIPWKYYSMAYLKYKTLQDN